MYYRKLNPNTFNPNHSFKFLYIYFYPGNIRNKNVFVYQKIRYRKAFWALCCHLLFVSVRKGPPYFEYKRVVYCGRSKTKEVRV